MRLKTLLIGCCICSTLCAEQLAMGSWRTHLTYTNTQIIAQTPDKVYGVSGGALYAIGKDDNAVEMLSKITGLNDNNITYIAYSKQKKMLVIGYNNSNIDLLSDNGNIYNITDIYHKNMTGSKSINHIYCSGKYAYLSCDFGIVALDLERREVADTYIIGTTGEQVPVLSLTECTGKWYATTKDNLMEAPQIGANLANFENWNVIATPTTSSNHNAVAYNGSIYLLQTDSTVYKRANGSWNKIYDKITCISAEGQHLFVSEDKLVHHQTPNNTSELNYSGIYMASCDSVNNDIWAAANVAGIACIHLNDNSVSLFRPNGPATSIAWRIKYSDGRIYVVPGGRWAVQYSRPGCVMIFEDGTWTNITESEITSYINSNQSFPMELPSIDFVDIAIDPSDKTHFFVPSYGIGLYEFRNDKPYMLYNADNSDIEAIYPDRKPNAAYYLYQRLDGVTYDEDGNLYFLNMGPYGITATVKYMDASGKIHKVPFSSISKVETAQDIVINSQNTKQKWVLIPRTTSNSNTAIFTYYDNGTPDQTGDDLSHLFTYFYDADGNKYAPTNFRCIAQDHDNKLWVGTSDGICVLNNQTKAFEDGYTCSRIKIPRNDGTSLADYLLDGIQINAIAVDGSNRKWIGTESNGVFLVSDDGLETIHHFTSDNSPLLSDNIISIGINEKTGEVFFGTGTGIISYQSDATEGYEQFSNVHAFPNPVREDFSGVITITGLVTDTRVKIVDIAGNLVYETLSNGGVATWDGNRLGGGRVATGVYMAMCFSPDGKQHATTKILIINK